VPHPYLKHVRRPGQTVNRLFTHLGIEVLRIDRDAAVLTLTIGPELLQGAGLAAGGVLATLLDEAMAHAVLAGNEPCRKTTTVDMQVSYLRAVTEGARLTSEARVVKRGSRVVFAEAVVRAVNGDDPAPYEAARATGTFLMT
jgi:uncharacterized protein (TIGR00369 family)